MRIFFIGMPGCGKTTVGRLCAEKLGLNFYDTDEESEKIMGMSPEKAIHDFGEKFFRENERKALEMICEKEDIVVATGGGIVTVKENTELMKRSGTVIFLKRDLEKLDRKGRPLSFDIESLYKKRICLYTFAANHELDNNGKIENTVSEFLKKYENFNH